MRRSFLLACLVGGAALTARGAVKERIIWECGQNVPNSVYWKAHGAELDDMLPFDGVMLKIEHPVTEGGTLQIAWQRNVGWMVFQKRRVTEAMVSHFVEHMKAAGL